jgi:hypothetical protein
MSTRVWRQLAEATPVAREHDSVLRLALCAMAADPDSALTAAQRSWIVDLGHRTDRFTAQERARIKTPLLAWVKARMPRCESIIEKQFTEEGP